ncbi:MAG TPA: hypothetical protein VI356_02785 [Myxococcales bacterium]
MRALLLVLLIPAAALANGAFPSARQVLALQAEPRRILLGATIGVVFTDDAGASWRYVCESYITGGPNVVLYAEETDGTLLALSSKLSRSTDGGCSWTSVPAPGNGAAWTDVFADPVQPARVLAIASTAARSGIWISNDGGQSFPSQLLDAAEPLASVESAATRPDTIYATGAAALLRTADGGASWGRAQLPVTAPAVVRIIAVSPADPATLWLRVSHPPAAAEEVLVSTDSGASFTTLYRSDRPLTGFARGTDGTVFLADGEAGILARAPRASAFRRLPGPHLLCLFASGSRLFGCADGLRDTYDAATSDDGGATWQPLLSLTTLLGPATCPAVASACASDWQFQQALLASARQKVAASGCGCRSAGAEGWLMAALVFAAHRFRPRRGGAA